VRVSRPPIAEAAQARFLMLCAEGRYAEAEQMLSIVYPNGVAGSSGSGDEVMARGAFYEDWGDAVIAFDPPVACTAYAQAEELFATVASWAEDRAISDVDRVQAKQVRLRA
jgi:hypothetical protein